MHLHASTHNPDKLWTVTSGCRSSYAVKRGWRVREEQGCICGPRRPAVYGGESFYASPYDPQLHPTPGQPSFPRRSIVHSPVIFPACCAAPCRVLEKGKGGMRMVSADGEHSSAWYTGRSPPAHLHPVMCCRVLTTAMAAAHRPYSRCWVCSRQCHHHHTMHIRHAHTRTPTTPQTGPSIASPLPPL